MIIAEDFYRRFLLAEVTSETEWLDLGAGWQLLREWLPNGPADQAELSKRVRRLVGIDAVASDVARNPYLHSKVVGDIHSLPFSGGSFNFVTAQMVIEHLESPPLLLREVRRVLRPGGKFVFLTPNYLNYQIFAAAQFSDSLKKRIVHYLEGRAEDDVFETHYRMNTPRRVRQFAQETGFSVDAIHMLHADWEFRRVPPLHWIERLLFLALDTKPLEGFRTDMLAVLSRAQT